MFKGAFHPADFAWPGLDSSGNFPPGCGRRCYLLDNCLGRDGSKTKIFGDRHDQIDVACSLVQIDVGGQDALTHIDGCWVEVVGRCRMPTRLNPGAKSM